MPIGLELSEIYNRTPDVVNKTKDIEKHSLLYQLLIKVVTLYVALREGLNSEYRQNRTNKVIQEVRLEKEALRAKITEKGGLHGLSEYIATAEENPDPENRLVKFGTDAFYEFRDYYEKCQKLEGRIQEEIDESDSESDPPEPQDNGLQCSQLRDPLPIREYLYHCHITNETIPMEDGLDLIKITIDDLMDEYGM